MKTVNFSIKIQITGVLSISVPIAVVLVNKWMIEII